MKRTVFLSAVAILVLAGGLAFNCDNGNGEPDPGNFSIEVAGDSVKQDTAMSQVNFYFNLRNHTTGGLTLTVDVPEELLDYPEGWWHSLCDEEACYPTPHDFEVAASGLLEDLHVTIGTSDSGTEGRIYVTVSADSEVDSQTFILNIQ